MICLPRQADCARHGEDGVISCQFSIQPQAYTFVVAELGESRSGMFMLDNENCILKLFSASNQIHGERASGWVLENTVSLLCLNSVNFNMLGVADGKLLLQGTQEYNSELKPGCISLDFKTRRFQRVRGMIHNGICPKVTQYTGYPLSLSLPTI